MSEGSAAVDATAGNGQDTLFLARKVGTQGHVYAFDIQQEALNITAANLEEAGLRTRVTLILDGHENMAGHIKFPPAVVMFNLGYLPGGGRGIVTEVKTTLAALPGALDLLIPGGLITITVYPGHKEGVKERDAIAKYCGALNMRRYTVLHLKISNHFKHPPELFLIKKLDLVKKQSLLLNKL